MGLIDRITDILIRRFNSNQKKVTVTSTPPAKPNHIYNTIKVMMDELHKDEKKKEPARKELDIHIGGPLIDVEQAAKMISDNVFQMKAEDLIKLEELMERHPVPGSIYPRNSILPFAYQEFKTYYQLPKSRYLLIKLKRTLRPMDGSFSVFWVRFANMDEPGIGAIFKDYRWSNNTVRVVPVSFEEVLENVPEDVYENILFNLDLFIGMG